MFLCYINVLIVFGRVVLKFHYCDPTRPDQTCLRPDKKIRTCRDWTDQVCDPKKPEKSATRPDKSATRPDFVGDPGRRLGSPTKSGRVAVVGFSLNWSCMSAIMAAIVQTSRSPVVKCKSLFRLVAVNNGRSNFALSSTLWGRLGGLHNLVSFYYHPVYECGVVYHLGE